MSATLTPPRIRKPRGQGPLRRGEIMQAAKALFLEEGIEHATMRRIAASVGVSSTALYVYFPDKTAILDAIAEDMFEALLVVHAATASLPEPPLARLRLGLQAYVDLAMQRSDEYRLTFGSTSPGACRQISAAEQSFEVLVRNVIELIEAGVFNAGDPMAISESLWAAMHGVVMLLLSKPEHLETPRDRLVDTVLNAIIRGFCTHLN